MKTQTAINYYLDSCLGRNLSPETVDWYRNVLRKFARGYPKLPKEPRQIEAFLASFKCAPETRHGYFSVLRAFFKFTAQRSKAPNPMVKVAAPRCPRKVMATMEPDEEMRLLHSVSNNSPSKLRDQTILTLFVDTGIRRSELAGLRRQDIKTETIRVRGKSGEREVPFSEETKRLLLTLIASNSKHEYVFQGHKGPLGKHGIYRIVSIHMRKAGIEGPKLGPHRIRHGFGKGFLVNGGDLRSLQWLMGHANITTTQKYTSLALPDIITKHHQFTPLRSAHAAAQGSFPDTSLAMKEAEAILAEKEVDHGS